MTPRLERVVVSAHRRRGLVFTGAALLAILSLFGSRGLTFDADVLRLLPKKGAAIPAFRTFLQRFGTFDDLYVVFTAPEGYTIADYEDVIARWTTSLDAAPEIVRVDGGRIDDSRDWGWLADHELLLLDDAHLSEALVRFSPAGMRSELARSRGLLSVPSREVTAMVRDDPLRLHELLQRQFGSTRSGLPFGLSQDGFATADGRRRLLIARPVQPPYDTSFSHALFNRLETIKREHAAAPRDEGGEQRPPLMVDFAGGHRIALETEAVVRRESIVNGVGSLALILPLLFLVFRSVRLVVIGSLPSALSFVLVLGVLGYAGLTLSAAAAGASAMLFGLGVDGVVLLYVTHRLALEQDLDASAAIRAMASPASSMLLGMWTTAATFLGLLVVDFPSLEQLGLLIGASMFTCGIATLVLVPAAMPARRPHGAVRSISMPRYARFVRGHRRSVLVAAAMMTVALGYAATWLRVNPTLERLRSVTIGASLLEEVTDTFDLPSNVTVLMQRGRSLDDLLEEDRGLMEAVRQRLPTMPVQSVSALLPPAAVQAARAALIRQTLPSVETISNELNEAAADSGFRPGSFAPFGARLPRLVAPNPLTLDDFATHGFSDIFDRFLVKAEDQWLLATYAFPRNAAESAALGATVAARGGRIALTGVAPVNDELSASLGPEFLKGLSLGTAIVIGLLLAAFRSARLVMLALLPTAIGLVWAAGILAAAGVELDLFALFAVITFVGIGVDYGIHLIHRYDHVNDLDRVTAELAPVIIVAGAITLFGYGTLVTSSYPPLRSIGVVSAISVVTLVIASVPVLPAVLHEARS